MISYLQKTFALSEKGARDIVKGCAACAVHNLALFLPVSILYLLVRDMLSDSLAGHGLMYALLCMLAAFLIMLTYRFVYKTTYFSTYRESGVRRIALAEKLRKIPLSFFSRKDLADITSTIMADCATLETGLSHWVPELIGALVSTLAASVCILFSDIRLGLAALWPLPAAFIIVFFSRRVQLSLGRKSMAARMSVADGIQEAVETMRDLKSCNAEKTYMNGLFCKIDTAEKRAVISEFGTAVFVVSASFILKAGIGTVALTGAYLLAAGQTDVLAFFLYLLIASRLYDPLQASLVNLAAVIALRTNVERMDEILFHEEKMAGFYNKLGELVYSRPIMPQEMQKTMFSINRKTGTES